MSEYTQRFVDEIAANRTGEVPIDLVELENGHSALSIRKRGCFIIGLNLSAYGVTAPILFAEDNHAEAKLTASHPMSPVGPYDGIGGQHGFPRWAGYHEFQLPDGPSGERRVSMQAMRSDEGLSMTRGYALFGSGLSIASTVRNSTEAAERTSLGEHLYFWLPNQDAAGLRLDHLPLDERLEEPGATEAIMNGQPYFWGGFRGGSLIHFPDGRLVNVAAHAFVETPEGEQIAADEELGMIIWHCKNTESICFEPTLGFRSEGDAYNNERLVLDGYHSVTLETGIALVMVTS